MKHLFSLIIVLISLCSISAQDSHRLIKGWEYVKGDLGSSWEAFRPTKQSKLPIWTPVNIPHSFNAYDAVDPDVAYYQGPGWYRTFLSVDNPYENGRTLLHFEGAGQKTEVYIYQTLVGKHVGGYDEFKIDVTHAVHQYLKDNPEATTVPLAVRCDNSRDVEMIPSDLSDFNIYGGLYRYVNLEYVPEISLEMVHMNYELDDKMKKAKVQIDASLFGDVKADKKLCKNM